MPNFVSVATVMAAALLVASPAIGQSNQPAATSDTTKTQPSAPQSGTAPGSQSVNFIQTMQPDTWRASKLIGKDVHDSTGQDIGDVSDVLVNRNGQVAGLVLDVGGFLGIGESQVAVPMQSVQFSGAGMTTGSTATTSTERLPDRVTVNVTKEQLKSAPKFDAEASAKK